MQELRIRCDNELEFNDITATLISTTNQGMLKYIGSSGSLVLDENITFDTVNFVFLVPDDHTGGFISSYLVEVLELESTIVFNTRNSTYIFRKDNDV